MAPIAHTQYPPPPNNGEIATGKNTMLQLNRSFFFFLNALLQCPVSMGFSFHLSLGRMGRTSELLADIQRWHQIWLSGSSQAHDTNKTIKMEQWDSVLTWFCYMISILCGVHVCNVFDEEKKLHENIAKLKLHAWNPAICLVSTQQLSDLYNPKKNQI